MTNRPPHICAVILHYGDPGLTARVHSQLLEGLEPRLQQAVRVLDNAAPETYAEAWTRLPENLFWAGALDWTVDHFIRNEPDYTHLWFLNNDVSFSTPGPHLPKAAARLQWIESRIGTVGVYSPSALRNPYHAQMVRNPDAQIRRTPFVDGIAPLWNLATLQELGGIDLRGNRQGYGVDIYTSLRQHQAGYGVVVDHQLALRHTYHSTARSIPGFLDASARAEQAYLGSRLGADYKTLLEELRAQSSDHVKL
ncbi:hypothetical protein SAMN02745704_02597 [Paucidesulfovibrio gracilis DSM 16080]|uniref:Glycosyltransferase, GT2 family n=1 Tax=Paucidesulfovibrio gracilis DSM 16080 TaxID=1121449 RepID=A0A1T4XYL4_9BACT|nr:hypothetical protein [Paucidesulfovibrio gracilis]SKA94644.1 hypothetical protein SAMN02745704_02597 [Paucidesulfovibrio gracilis DSM 16080]